MSEIHDLERVIRSVTRGTEATRDSERRVIVDIRRGRAVDSVGLLDFMREFKYFIVSNSQDGTNEGFGAINLTHRASPASDHTVNIKVNYKAWCPPGREKQLAEVLHHGNDPGEALNGLMTRWVLEHLGSQNGSSRASGPESKSFLEAAIRTKAQMETGLAMDVDFEVGRIRPTTITDTFPVRAKDYYREETLTIRMDIARETQFSAIPYPEPALRELIRISVQDYFAHNVSLQSLYFDLKTDDFSQLLKRELNGKLKPSRCQIDALLLDRSDQDDAELHTLLTGIQIEVSESEGEFETVIPNLFVNLNLSLAAQLNDIRAIKPFLERQQHVPTLMKRAVIEATRQFVRETHPAEIYGQFSLPDTENKSAFENRLRAKLSDLLTNRFHAETGRVILKTGETEITKTLGELQKERCEFNVLIPRNRRNAEDCLFRGHFKIDGIDRNGWEEFRRALPNIGQVRERLGAAIKTALENDPTALISLKHTLSLHDVQKIAEQAASNAILNDFGLRVTITNIGGDDVESERKIAETVIKARTKSVEGELDRYSSVTALVTAEIRKLEHDMVLIKATGVQEDAIEGIQKRIDALREYSPTEPIISNLYYENLRGAHSSGES